MSLASAPTRRQREILRVGRLLGSGHTPAQAIRHAGQSGIHRAAAAAHVRRLRHLRLPAFVLREVLRLSPDQQFDRAMLHLIVARKFEAKARVMLAKRQRQARAKGGAV